MSKIHSKNLRYAHAEGHTDVCYTEDGKHIITCGHDGDVRIWLDIEDDNPNSHCVGESTIAVCFKDKRLYVATGNHAVQAYTFPAFDKDGIVTRFTAPVTQIISGSKNEALGCTSENMEAKICSPEGGEPLFIMTEHKGPVLSIAICPQMKFSATACGDGVLRIWDIDTQKVVKEIDCVPKINTFFAAKVLCRMDFEPSEGKFLAYPNNREIILLDCESWGQRMTFTQSSIKCAISHCLFSPCGQYLAGSTLAGQIAVWAVQAGTCMGVVEHPTSHRVSAMAWNPKGNGVLVYCDVAGQLGLLENCYGTESNKEDQSEDVEMVDRVDDPEDIVDELIERYESDDDAVSLDRIKNDTLRPESLASSRPESRLAPATVAPQPPFQPSSSPTHLEHRYMCWNEVGIVRSHTSENGESNIEVEFHDTSVHHGIHLNNYLNHTMASLSNTVLALACPIPSKLVCISLVGSSKEWSVSLPDLEEAVCVTAAAGLVACATSARLLRLFTPMGTQRQVISLYGPVVTLAAHNTTVFAVYHSSDPGVTDQHLAMDIITVNGGSLVSRRVPLALSAAARLAWLGSSDTGAACAADTAGVVRLLPSPAAAWLPLCHTTHHARSVADTWFVVSVSESTQTVRAIQCRGTSYPLTAPKPIVTELPLQVPMCEPESEQAQLEEKLVRWAHTATSTDLKTARETALKLFALACRSEIEQRAFELMDLLRDERLLPLAAKYASRLGRMHLADKLAGLAETWEGEGEREQLNVARASSQMDVFDTQDSCNASSEQVLNTSLIIPCQVKERREDRIAPIKPVPMRSSFGIRNPFKKQQDNTKAVQSPLSLTDRNLVEIQTPADSEENTDPLKPHQGETFVDWFSRNRTIMESQHPELTPSELTRQGIKTFKTVQVNNSTGNSTENGHKRKLDNETTNEDSSIVTNVSKQSKLSDFAFQKKS